MVTRVLCAVALLTAAYAQRNDPGAAITADLLRAHVTELASDRMQGRETGSPGFDRAAKYVARVFRSLHLQALTPDYLDAFRIRRARVLETSTELMLTLSAPRVTRCDTARTTSRTAQHLPPSFVRMVRWCLLGTA